MSEEKQIEEMTIDLCQAEFWDVDEDCCDLELDRRKTAENLYNAGYRKQSEGEWIEQGECWKTLRCSVCGHTTDTIFDRTPFCPNCGARMKGG